MTEATIPPSLRTVAAALDRARGEERRLREVFDHSHAPMVLVDGERRYADANGPARLTFRLNIDGLRGHAVDDLAPPHRRRAFDQIWARLLSAGWVTGSYQVAGLDGSGFDVVYYGVANALPGLHLGAFAPANWPEGELDTAGEAPGRPPVRLTPRQREVLTLAACGCSGPEIARRLVVSPATVKTHFAHIHEKLGVRSRAAAVAEAMQLGLINGSRGR